METKKFYDVVVVGAGITGATIAERCASRGMSVCVLEKRNHIGGNVYDYTDEQTGIRINQYGAHIFHTNDVGVWTYIQKFSDWVRWDHRVLAYVNDTFVPIPVNQNTINGIYNMHLQNEQETKEWLEKEKQNVNVSDTPKNSYEMAVSRVGERLYETLFKPYTIKQWEKDPSDLDAEVLSRIPVRTNTDDRYFTDKYQALPKNGYTSFVTNMLQHPSIHVQLNTDFESVKDTLEYKHLIYTGPIDTYFSDRGLPKLEYRSIDFSIERISCCGFYQPSSVVNYPSMDVPFTRIVEYKHFLNQSSSSTILIRETTKDDGEPYYPVPNERNKKLYEIYKDISKQEGANVHFIGRLASYKYFNMDQAIRCALDYVETLFGYSTDNK